MNEHLDPDISEFRSDRLWVIATDAPEHPTYRLISLCFVVAGLAHLWLADAWQLSWLPGNICFIAGLVLLLFRPCSLAWALLCVGKFLPLFFARDHLTQSVLMMIASGGGAFFVGLHAYLRSWPEKFTVSPSTYGEISVPIWAFFDLLRLLTIITYAAAAVHKINRDFFTPDVSCATHGLNRILTYYDLPSLPLIETWAIALAIFVIALEAGIAVLYILGRRRLALIFAIIFHIPLTLTMAPAFAFVMLIGHAAFLRPTDLDAYRQFLSRRGVSIGILALGITAVSVLVAKDIPEWTMIPREFLLWALLFTAILARPWRPELPTAVSWQNRHWPRAVAWSLGALFALHSLTPYLGVRFQHTGAMVSNLRIDEGCWNSLILPESLRIRDDYIRVDQVYFQAPGLVEKYEGIVLEQLWNGTQVRQMRRNWCRPELQPFYLKGTYRGRTFEIADLCAEEFDWPFDDDGIFGVEFFPDHLLFQRNLPRECPQICIH